jgi:outer membrane receptor protein involved in Fe transport
MSSRLVGALAVLLPLAAAGTSLQAQTDTTRTAADSARRVVKLAPIAVTAARVDRPIFNTPNPVLVLDSTNVREESPNGIADLFRNLPGVDVTGVGPNQSRLIIRGQRGQRILLTENGIRLNNSRRQQDFGELPSFTDINGISRVEVVRGPASVLYGTDAIGGVVNQITLAAPGNGTPDGVRGTMSYRYGSAAEQQTVHGTVTGRSGRLGFALTAGYRDAGAYEAPEGTFGNLTLNSNTKVNDTGVIDRNFSADLGYDIAEGHTVDLRVSHYGARDAGFGYVAPADLGDPDGATVQILYPDQDVTRVTAGYRATGVNWGIADRFSITGYGADNDRIFTQFIGIPLGEPFPPGSGIDIRTRNSTDIRTYGARVEAAKILGGRHSVIYGVDWYRDRANNADTSVTETRMFGPPTTETNTAPTLPNATLWSGGVFAQSDLALTDRFTLGLGIRAQTIHSDTRETEGLPEERAGVSASNSAVVGAVSGRYQLTSAINLVATVGRAFRAPNLVERYFEGNTPEGNGFQLANPDLEPETSLNYDLGVKVRTGRVYAEVIYFANRISDGIRIVPTGTTVNDVPGFRNENIDKLTDRGVETLAEVVVGAGFSVLGHFTKLTSKTDEESPTGDGYSSKLGGELLWREPRGRFFAAYEVRHQGERDDVELTASPVGETIPAFTVHNVRAGVRLGVIGRTAAALTVGVLNLTDELYSEASNTAFFRPEPRRNAQIGVRLDF